MYPCFVSLGIPRGDSELSRNFQTTYRDENPEKEIPETFRRCIYGVRKRGEHRAFYEENA